MIIFLIKENMIKIQDIKFVVNSSLTVSKDHFNEFIDHIYSINDGREKFQNK